MMPGLSRQGGRVPHLGSSHCVTFRLACLCFPFCVSLETEVLTHTESSVVENPQYLQTPTVVQEDKRKWEHPKTAPAEEGKDTLWVCTIQHCPSGCSGRASPVGFSIFYMGNVLCLLITSALPAAKSLPPTPCKCSEKLSTVIHRN